MATVQDILDFVAYRIDTTADLFPLINGAVKTIGRRLYTLRSSLILDEMKVKVFAEKTYTASTIAFEKTDPDTITDSAAQFIVEGFQKDMAVETDDSLNEGPFRLSAAAAGSLTVSGETGVLSEVAAGTSVTVTSLDTFGYLPSDFWGMSDDLPYINATSRKWELEPLPSQEVALAYLSAGEPRYFKIKNDKLYITPGTATDYTIKADYFKQPASIGDLEDTIPFNGLFDETIAEAVVRFYNAGLQNEAGLTAFQLFIKEQVDLVVAGRDYKAATPTPKGINWHALT